MRAVLAETRGGFSCGIGLLTLDFFFGAAFFDARLVAPDALMVDDDRALLFGLEFEAFAFDFDLAAASAFAFRLNRRWTLVIASTNSSFRIPCHPATP